MATKGTLKYRKVTRTPQSGPNKNKQMDTLDCLQELILRNTKTWSNAELRKKCRIEEYDTYGNTTDEGSVPGDGKDNDGGGGSTPSGGDSGTTAPDGGDGLE